MRRSTEAPGIQEIHASLIADQNRDLFPGHYMQGKINARNPRPAGIFFPYSPFIDDPTVGSAGDHGGDVTHPTVPDNDRGHLPSERPVQSPRPGP